MTRRLVLATVNLRITIEMTASPAWKMYDWSKNSKRNVLRARIRPHA